MENWKIIEECPDYAISDTGLIKSLRKDLILSLSLSGKGKYYKINLPGFKDVVGKCKVNVYVHRFVAKYFCEGYSEDRCFVNHKNGIKTDNRAENLEWVTMNENNEHSRLVLKNSQHIPVVCFNKKGDVVGRFISKSEALRNGFTIKYMIEESAYSKQAVMGILNKPRKKRVQRIKAPDFYNEIDGRIIDIVISLHSDGINIYNICKKTGMSEYKISTILRRNNCIS